MFRELKKIISLVFKMTEKSTNLIVNYLPQNMSHDDIKSLFSSFGELESCKLIKDKMTGQNLGYGFVNYINSDNAMKAVNSLNGLKLQNKIIKVSIARPSCNQIKGANLYVGGLPRTMTIQELDSLFSPYGNIITSRILIDSRTDFSKGVGFVRFDLKSEAEQAINELNGINLIGSCEPIVVKFANHPSVTTSPLNSDHISIFQENLPGCTLYVHNISILTNELSIWQKFGPYGAVQNVKLHTDESYACAIVTMASQEDAILAMAMTNATKLDNNTIYVSIKRPRTMTDYLQRA